MSAPSTAIGARQRNRDEFLPSTLRSRIVDHDQRIGPRRGKADNNRGTQMPSNCLAPRPRIS
jgi:hypothetical protein